MQLIGEKFSLRGELLSIKIRPNVFYDFHLLQPSEH